MSPRPLKGLLAVLLLLNFIGPSWVLASTALHPEEIISSEDLKKKLEAGEDLLLLDARNKQSFDEGHITVAVLPRGAEFYRQADLFKNGILKEMPDTDKALVEWVKDQPRERLMVTYCNSDCHASEVLALRLKQLGFTRVLSMEEGFQAWEKKGYPVQREGVVGDVQ